MESKQKPLQTVAMYDIVTGYVQVESESFVVYANVSCSFAGYVLVEQTCFKPTSQSTFTGNFTYIFS